jgi:hypothetical protein
MVAQREVQVFRSFEAAERADDEYYAGLDPQERLGILLDLVAAYRESTGETSDWRPQPDVNMYRVDERDRVTELRDFPQSSVGAPIPLVLADELLAHACE